MLSPNFIDCEQGTEAWFACRIGAVTSSRIASVVAKRKRGDGDLACRINLKWELVSELLTNKAAEHFVSEWMDLGARREPMARAEYGARNDCYIETVGFAYHPTIKLAGASPDGVIGECRGLLEIKCPKIETHLQYLANGVIPDDYLPQMVWQLACVPDAQYNDFVSFHPDVREEYQLFVKRLERTKEVSDLIRGYEAEVEQFNGEVQQIMERLKVRAAEMKELVTA